MVLAHGVVSLGHVRSDSAGSLLCGKRIVNMLPDVATVQSAIGAPALPRIVGMPE